MSPASGAISDICKKISAAGIGILIALIILEAGLRLFPQPVRTDNSYRWNSTVALGDGYADIFPYWFDKRLYYAPSQGRIDYHFDSLGARTAGPAAQPPSGPSIVVVGDSLTFGFGLRFEDSYPRLVEKCLRSRGTGVSLLNFARPGWNAVDSARQYARVRDWVPHRMLIYGLHLNDLINFPTSQLAAASGKEHPGFLSFSAFYRFADEALKRRRERRRIIGEILGHRGLDDELARMNLAAIRDMKALADEKHADFLVLILPVLIDLGNYPFKPIHRRLAEVLRKEGIDFLDVTPAFARKKAERLWILPFDQHPNETATPIIADELCEFLVRR